MAIRLGINKWLFKEPNLKSDDLNDTFSAVTYLGVSAEMVYKFQQALGYLNGDSTFAEKSTVASGLQGSINIGSTDAVFNTNLYECKKNNPNFNLDSISNAPKTGTKTPLKLTVTPNNTGYISEMTFYSVGGYNVTMTVTNNDTSQVIATKTGLGNIALSKSIYSELMISGTTYDLDFTADTGDNMPFYTVNTSSTNFSISGDLITHPTVTGGPIYFQVDEPNYESSLVVHDSNTLPINSETKAFCLHHEGEIPTDTTVEYEVSDGKGIPDGTDDTTNIIITPTTPQTNITDRWGIKINPNENMVLKSITKLSLVTATKCYLMDSTGTTIIEEVNFVGDLATFSGTSLILSGGEYLLVADNNGSQYTAYRESITTPIAGTYFDIISGWAGSMLNNTIFLLDSVVTETASVEKITLPINPITKKSQVVSRGTLAEVDNAVITCKLNTTDVAKTPTYKGCGAVQQ